MLFLSNRETVYHYHSNPCVHTHKKHIPVHLYTGSGARQLQSERKWMNLIFIAFLLIDFRTSPLPLLCLYKCLYSLFCVVAFVLFVKNNKYWEHQKCDFISQWPFFRCSNPILKFTKKSWFSIKVKQRFIKQPNKCKFWKSDKHILQTSFLNSHEKDPIASAKRWARSCTFHIL